MDNSESTEGKAIPISGNITLFNEEIDELRTAVIKTYAKRPDIKMEDPERDFNSNWRNSAYVQLIDHICQITGEDLSKKALGALLYFSKHSDGNTHTLRKRAANALCLYAFGITIDQFLDKHNASPEEISIFDNIRGVWTCYYDKDGDFTERMRIEKKARLYKFIFYITGDSVRNAKVRYYHFENSGSGSIEVKGSNLFFNLTNENRAEPLHLFMNLGARMIDDSPVHFRHFVGCFLYIDSTGAPKAGKCMMQFEENEPLFNLDDKIVLNSKKKEIDYDEFSLLERKEKYENIEAFFFAQKANTINSSVQIFNSVLSDSKLELVKLQTNTLH